MRMEIGESKPSILFASKMKEKVSKSGPLCPIGEDEHGLYQLAERLKSIIYRYEQLRSESLQGGPKSA